MSSSTFFASLVSFGVGYLCGTYMSNHKKEVLNGDNTNVKKENSSKEENNGGVIAELHIEKPSEADRTNYNRITKDYRSSSEGSKVENKKSEKDISEETTVNKPYVIDPRELGDTDYSIDSLLYFEDGVLTDDDLNPILQSNNIIGDALMHFGEYEDDSVCVRNDELKKDFEILKDIRKYNDIKKNSEIIPDD